MPLFQVKAQDSRKQPVSLTMEAASRVEVVRQIKAQGMIPLEVIQQGAERVRKESAQKEAKPVKGASAKKTGKAPLSFGGPKAVKQMEVVIFCRQISIAVSAGLPLRDALEGIIGSMGHNTLSATLRPAAEALHSGVSFSEAIKAFNRYKVFSPVFIGLIRVAEETGTMGQTLSQLADYLEGMVKLKSSVSSKLSYPIFMIVAFILVNIGATLFLFPMFKKNFAEIGSKLPAITQFAFDTNDMALKAFPFVSGIVIAIVAGVCFYRSTPIGRRGFDSALLKIPMFGPILLKIGLARFCKTLSITANGGVPLVQGLEISSIVVGNKYLERSLMQVREKVVTGNRFASTLRATGNFPDLVVRMIDVGEDSGQLPLVLEKIADIYDTEVGDSIAKMIALVEPVLICLFGVFVTVMVLALYMPVFSMSSGM
ncbi:MAG: type II secretion system F family protein [Pontiellaceae bacterium]|jgi:type IV pilus assembly protein PilC|nr:type II secretion system F family protein [Pontiellaceae bacterium]